MANELNTEKKVQILHDMMEGMSIRGLHRTKKGNTGKSGHPSRTTIAKLLADAGDTAIAFLNDRMRDLPTTVVQADEFHSYVGIRGITLLKRKMRAPEGKGVRWVWVAIDPISKLIVSWHVGGRGKPDARKFYTDLKKRCPNRLQLTTDSHGPSIWAVDKVWGGDIDYATVKKNEENERQFVIEEYLGEPPAKRVKRPKREMPPPEPRSGQPDMSRVTTNHIETFFQKVRKDLARARRATTLFSKTTDNLKRALALYFFYRNFIFIHETLKTTPAVAAGIDDSVWTWEEFVALVDETRAERKAKRDASRAREAELVVEEKSSVIALPDRSSREAEAYTVMCAIRQGYAKIHRSDCKHLRADPDRETKTGASHKFPCRTLEEAWEIAYNFVPDEIEECKVCLGKPSRLDTGRGKGGSNLKH